MTDAARPSSGEARVCAAVALGWQMAKLGSSTGAMVLSESKPPPAAEIPATT